MFIEKCQHLVAQEDACTAGPIDAKDVCSAGVSAPAYRAYVAWRAPAGLTPQSAAEITMSESR